MNCLSCDGILKEILLNVFDTRFGIEGDYTIMRCEKCGLVQTSPRPTSRELKVLYEK